MISLTRIFSREENSSKMYQRHEKNEVFGLIMVIPFDPSCTGMCNMFVYGIPRLHQHDSLWQNLQESLNVSTIQAFVIVSPFPFEVIFLPL